MKIVVLGGGYAGLSCLLTLRRRCPEAKLSLVDARTSHVKLTRLHQTLRRPFAEITCSFEALAEKFGFAFHQAQISWSDQGLTGWQSSKVLALPQGELPFDYLVIATGTRTPPLPRGESSLSREDLLAGEGREKILDMRRRMSGRVPEITVVGAGATGLQFLFELHATAVAEGWPVNLHLVDLSPRLLSGHPAAFDRYTRKRLRELGIRHHPAVRYLGQEGGAIRLQGAEETEPLVLPCDLVLLFPGVQAVPRLLETNRYGQVLEDGLPLNNIYAAGDCSRYLGSGLNAQTAQAALRKGALVAENIAQSAAGRRQKTYLYREIGYFVSLGAADGVGWLGWRGNVLTGTPAFAVKEVLEAQYDLFLRGIDSYLK
ncbi:NAD(P)/FAD-dependent oxidoreductase [Geoalkalibacter sp.]|uniref:NAD(P)/FAD-dependent oxidoreductase n=1 Tax=Geoalkalibacter sp. TaxID=3041440 RepID=UPI00272EB9BC|nr:FAD-dependent oxidoreductase [Geoalkalibacter sp.]